jgi:hypothetical protein
MGLLEALRLDPHPLALEQPEDAGLPGSARSCWQYPHAAVSCFWYVSGSS